MNHLSHAILSQTQDGKWFARLMTAYGGVFQLLEVYEGDAGRAYWEQRLAALGCEIRTEARRTEGN